MTKGTKNAYVCDDLHITVTVDKDEGTTPFAIQCTHPGCEYMAMSRMGRVSQDKQATHEFYRETDEAAAAAGGYWQDHHNNGGLFMREISGAVPNPVFDKDTAVMVPMTAGDLVRLSWLLTHIDLLNTTSQPNILGPSTSGMLSEFKTAMYQQTVSIIPVMEIEKLFLNMLYNEDAEIGTKMLKDIYNPEACKSAFDEVMSQPSDPRIVAMLDKMEAERRHASQISHEENNIGIPDEKLSTAASFVLGEQTTSINGPELYNRNDVVGIIDLLLQYPDQLNNAIGNENTEWNAEELYALALGCIKPDEYPSYGNENEYEFSYGNDLIGYFRAEQIQKHGYTPEYDTQYQPDTLLYAAVAVLSKAWQIYWPSSMDISALHKIYEKPHIERIAVAGAFLAAELDAIKYRDENPGAWKKTKVKNNPKTP